MLSYSRQCKRLEILLSRMIMIHQLPIARVWVSLLFSIFAVSAGAQSNKIQFDVLDPPKQWHSRGGTYSTPEEAAFAVCNSLPACGPRFTVTQFRRENCATARFRCSGTVGFQCDQYVETYLWETAQVEPQNAVPRAREQNGAWCPGWNPYQGQKAYLFDGPYGSGTPQTGWAFSPGKQDCKCRRPVIPYRFEGCTAGNPVSPGSGLKIEKSDDYIGQGSASLSFARNYRSSLSGENYGWQAGGWSHNFNARLSLDPYDQLEQIVTAIRPDGVARRFRGTRSSSAVVWTADNGTLDTLTEIRDANGITTGFTYRVFANDSLETYSPSGQLQRITHANGWTTTLEYSTSATATSLYLNGSTPIAGLLIGVRNHFGRQIRFVYDGAGRMVQMLPPGTNKDSPAGSGTSPIRYAYNEPNSLGSNVQPTNQLTSVTWQDGTVRRYIYENSFFPNNLSGIVDETGTRISTYLYDMEGRVSEEFKPGMTDRLQFSYGHMSESVSTSDRTATFQTTITDFNGPNGAASSRTYNYTAFGGGVARPVAVSAPCPLCGNTAANTTYGDGTTAGGGLGAQGQKIREVAHDGSVTFYLYNAKGQETERATYGLNYGTSTTRPALSLSTAVVSTRWHATWNLPTQIAQPGQITSYGYNAKGMLTGLSTVATTDATGAAKFSAVRTGPVRATGYGYNTNSLNTTIVERTDGVETQRWTLAYNASGDLTRITDVTGGNQSATLTNDAHGRLTRLAASNGALATFGANSRGQMITANTPSGNVSYVYDARNLINEIRFGDGRWVRYSYSAAQKLIEIRDSSGLVEVIAAGESEGLDPQRLALRVAQWLADRGDRVAQMLVPQAHAQPQLLLIPVAIVWGLMATAEGQRNNGGSMLGPGAGGAGCCGRGSDPSAPESPSRPTDSWLTRIGVMLSGQSQPGNQSTAPIYDKAGLLVSQAASCVLPPGNCKPEDYDRLQEEVKQACGDPTRPLPPRRCMEGQTLVTLTSNMEQHRSCGMAREKLNKKCFAGGDKTHRDKTIEAWEGVARCEAEIWKLLR